MKYSQLELFSLVSVWSFITAFSVAMFGCAVSNFAPTQPADSVVAASTHYVYNPIENKTFTVGHLVELGNYYLAITNIQTGERLVPRSNASNMPTAFPWSKNGASTPAVGNSGAVVSSCGGDARIIYYFPVNRWIYSAFTGPGTQRRPCFAISKTSDPTAGWYFGAVAEATDGSWDWMNIACSADWCAVVDGGTGRAVAIHLAEAINGNFGNRVQRNFGLDVRPARTQAATDRLYLVSIDTAPANQPAWKVHHWFPATNTVQTYPSTSTVNDPQWWANPRAQTPQGEMLEGNKVMDAYLSTNNTSVPNNTVYATGVSNCGGVACAYLAQIPVNGAVPAKVTHSTYYGHGTYFPSIVVDDELRWWVSALSSSQTLPPTHVVAFGGPVSDLAFGSVQQYARALNIQHTLGDGNGPTPTEPRYLGGPIRGPDYVQSAVDPIGNVWLTGQWVSGGVWRQQTVYWNE